MGKILSHRVNDAARTPPARRDPARIYIRGSVLREWGMVPPSEAEHRPGHVSPPATARIAPARAAAFHILGRVASSAAHSDDLLHSIAVNALSAEDRNLTTALVLGVLRWSLALDAAIRPLLQRPDAELHPAALLALRMGAYQLRHMDRIPAHAALNDSVELARANGAAHAAGMVNAILRRLQRERSSGPRASSPGQPARDTLAIVTEAELAHPAWLLARWRRFYGGKATRLIAGYDQAEPPAHALFAREQPLPGAIGALEIDDGSRLVAELAAASVPQPRRILDCCAAPGGKTAVLAARHTSAEIVAADISERRLATARRRLDRFGLQRVTTVLADLSIAPQHPALAGTFDLILCDMPCSGTGTLARNPEIRHRLRETDLPRQADRQRAILSTALALLSPGGRLVYSTCSLEPEENEAVITDAVKQGRARPLDTAYLLEELPGLLPAQVIALRSASSRGSALRTLPGVHASDGFFIALIERAPA